MLYFIAVALILSVAIVLAVVMCAEQKPKTESKNFVAAPTTVANVITAEKNAVYSTASKTAAPPSSSKKTGNKTTSTKHTANANLKVASAKQQQMLLCINKVASLPPASVKKNKQVIRSRCTAAKSAKSFKSKTSGQKTTSSEHDTVKSSTLSDASGAKSTGTGYYEIIKKQMRVNSVSQYALPKATNL